MNTRKNAQAGFTIIELLIVTVILGILGALAYPTFASMVRRARYAEVKQQMGAIAREVSLYQVEQGSYPPDVGPNVQPEGVTSWPEKNELPYQTSLDYDHWGVGGNQCYVQIGYAGETPSRSYSTHSVNRATPGFEEFDDDVILSIALYDCSASPGAIR